MFKIETKTFFETLHISELYVFFKATMTMTSLIYVLVFNNLNKLHKSSWNYQEFTYQIEPLSLVSKVPKL